MIDRQDLPKFRMARTFPPDGSIFYRVETAEPLTEREALGLMRNLGSPYAGQRYPNRPTSTAAPGSWRLGQEADELRQELADARRRLGSATLAHARALGALRDIAEGRITPPPVSVRTTPGQICAAHVEALQAIARRALGTQP